MSQVFIPSSVLTEDTPSLGPSSLKTALKGPAGAFSHKEPAHGVILSGPEATPAALFRTQEGPVTHPTVRSFSGGDLSLLQVGPGGPCPHPALRSTEGSPQDAKETLRCCEVAPPPRPRAVPECWAHGPGKGAWGTHRACRAETTNS